jgi:hypothetical protein
MRVVVHVLMYRPTTEAVEGSRCVCRARDGPAGRASAVYFVADILNPEQGGA